jgi:hypothetical protein
MIKMMMAMKMTIYQLFDYWSRCSCSSFHVELF